MASEPVAGAPAASRGSLVRIYLRLRGQHGRQLWWPGSSPFEIAVGAVLTQRVAWRNAEQAVHALRAEGWLSARALHSAPVGKLADRIRPALFYNQKAKRLKDLAKLLCRRFDAQLEVLFRLDVDGQREVLQSVSGIGPETADAIVLYAGGRPSFVVDAYTRRILGRMGVVRQADSYDGLRSLFMDHLPHSVALYQQYHALFVVLGRTVCTRRVPRCGACRLSELCERGSETKAARTPSP
ncbi:MAG: endonuclease III domain-containing protein [Candidatus Bipolaricaulota bacterium]|nr:MAG: endonuclease III domain-containing protein [Candidatus Bipolaricaulota bacterium]